MPRKTNTQRIDELADAVAETNAAVASIAQALSGAQAEPEEEAPKPKPRKAKRRKAKAKAPATADYAADMVAVRSTTGDRKRVAWIGHDPIAKRIVIAAADRDTEAPQQTRGEGATFALKRFSSGIAPQDLRAFAEALHAYADDIGVE